MSWVTEAIEREALARAERTHTLDTHIIFGLSEQQVLALIACYRSRIPGPLHTLSPECIKVLFEHYCPPRK